MKTIEERPGRAGRLQNSCCSHGAPSPCSAFTLIELLAVMLIILILLVIGITSLPRMQRAWALNQAAGNLLAAAELARQTALTKHTSVTLVLNGGQNGDQPGSQYTVLIKNQYPVSDYALAESSWPPPTTPPNTGWNELFYSNTVLYLNNASPNWGSKVPLQDVSYTVHPSFSSGLLGRLPDGTMCYQFPAARPCRILAYGSADIKVKNVTPSQPDVTIQSDEYFGLPGSPFNSTAFGGPMMLFNSRGESDMTATVGVWAVGASGTWSWADTNSANWVRLVFTQGSSRIQVVRP
jgi:prepilin-type N-terminal cleavage/methylation domain-containing protein